MDYKYRVIKKHGEYYLDPFLLTFKNNGSTISMLSSGGDLIITRQGDQQYWDKLMGETLEDGVHFKINDGEVKSASPIKK